MSIFNVNNLILESNDSTNLLQTTYIEESYFNTTLSFISECRQELRQNTKELYVSILESGENYEVVTESFSDFFQAVKKVIDKFIAYIKSLFNRFIAALSRFVQSEKYLIKHRKDLIGFESKHEFDFDGYEFTLVDTIPSIQAEAAFNKDFVSLDFDEILKIKDPAKVLALISKQHGELSRSLKDDRYDVFRQEVICADAPIDSSDFISELFAVYRNGETQTSDIEITNSRVIESLDRLENYKKYKNSTSKTKDKIEKEYNSIKKSIENMVYRNKDNDVNKLLGIEIKGDYDGGNGPVLLSSEAMAKVDLFIKDKVTEVIELSNIHAIAFSNKLDAIADCYKQDKKILYMALNKIQKDINKK